MREVMKRVEKMAKELVESIDGAWSLEEDIPKHRKMWLKIARHVLIREIRLRIEEIEEPSSEYYKDGRLAALTATLKELEDNNAPTQ